MMLPTAILVASLISVSVIDGDTIDISGERIRIANIDAPEIRTPKCDAEKRLGNIAKMRMVELLEEGPITITRGDPDNGRLIDRNGRTLATIAVAGRDVGLVLIDEGLARPWRGKREPWC